MSQSAPQSLSVGTLSSPSPLHCSLSLSVSVCPCFSLLLGCVLFSNSPDLPSSSCPPDALELSLLFPPTHLFPSHSYLAHSSPATHSLIRHSRLRSIHLHYYLPHCSLAMCFMSCPLASVFVSSVVSLICYLPVWTLHVYWTF